MLKKRGIGGWGLSVNTDVNMMGCPPPRKRLPHLSNVSLYEFRPPPGLTFGCIFTATTVRIMSRHSLR